ncbi:MAG: CRISPR system precrRNA processing endoribonuclease RAMP protein Cas6 [Thermodesulfobacteriota bacterium]
MLYGEYKIVSVLEDHAVLPPFKGSTIRGFFGHAFKAVVCALKRQECKGCLLRQQCAYYRVFETPAELVGGGASPPHPFVLEPPLSEQTDLPKGADFPCSLLLFGEANRLLPYFVYAFDRMGERGIGRRIDGKRPALKLQTVSAAGQVIYSAADGMLEQPGPERLDLSELARETPHASKITVILETPLRVQHRGQYQAELPFHVLVRAALRRVSSLCAHYGDGEPALDYRGLVAHAADIQVDNADLDWCAFRRYSNRQEQEMMMGGIIGYVTYRGDLSDYLPVLRFCEKVHLGKASTFGLGKIRLHVDEEG